MSTFSSSIENPSSFRKSLVFRSKPNSRGSSSGRPKLLSEDYLTPIDAYLKQKESESQISSQFLKAHKITGPYRAKMVDWMLEVLSAFHCADQTFFLAVSLMDRYFDALSQAYQLLPDPQYSLELNELHITGIVAMFMASKYEDIFPLLMKTVVKKIGHEKITQDSVRARESHIL